MSGEESTEKLKTAISMVETLFPNAVHVLAAMDVRLDERVGTAAVTPSGRMLFAPDFLRQLTVRQCVFIVAHELYHVLYGVFDRFDSDTPPYRRWLVNIAHDFIVNGMLEKRFSAESFQTRDGPESIQPTGKSCQSSFIPPGGLFWADYAKSYAHITGKPQPPIESFSLESLVVELERIRDELPGGNPLARMVASPRRPWGTGLGGLLDQLEIEGSDGKKSRQVGNRTGEDTVVREEGRSFADILGDHPELLTEREEAELFPDGTALERKSSLERMREVSELAAVRDILRNQVATVGCGPGDGDCVVQALSGFWRPPWEGVLQKWLDDTAPPIRSWAKASRRMGDRTDLVLPGHAKDGYTLNIVVDTSGSMTELLPAVFGMIQSFGRNANVQTVRIVQCDMEVSADDLVDIDDLDSFEAKGFGGSDMSPGLLRLAEDPAVEAVLVLTDGDIDFPPKETIPYDVLWCLLTYQGCTSHFEPGYGTVTSIPEEDILSM